MAKPRGRWRQRPRRAHVPDEGDSARCARAGVDAVYQLLHLAQPQLAGDALAEPRQVCHQDPVLGHLLHDDALTANVRDEAEAPKDDVQDPDEGREEESR
jgi:hypothetical protein